MKKYLGLSLSIFLCGLFVLPVSVAQASSDDECAIWLCLPSGFGEGCGGAHSAFKNRLKKGKSPLPDWNSCSEGNDPEPYVYRRTYYTVTNDGKRVTQASGSNCPSDGYIYWNDDRYRGIRAICTVMEKYVTTMNDDGSQYIHEEERWGRPLEQTKGNNFKPSR